MADAPAEHHDHAAETTGQDSECRKLMPESCPIQRMGKVANTTSGRDGGVDLVYAGRSANIG